MVLLHYLIMLLHWNNWVESDWSGVGRLLGAHGKVVVKLESVLALLLRLNLN